MREDTDVVPKHDEFSVYGEHIANKLWNSGRSHQETPITDHHIE
jgi:hypothetical protein